MRPSLGSALRRMVIRNCVLNAGVYLYPQVPIPRVAEPQYLLVE